MARKGRTAKYVSLGDVLSVLSTFPYWQFNSKFRMGDEFRVIAVDIPHMDYGGYPIITATCIHKGAIENDPVENRIELGETAVFTASMPVYAHLRVNGQAPVGYCEKPDVNELLAEKDKDIAYWREEYDKETKLTDALNAEIESLKASHYAEMVDAGMRERRLRRALYKACANWADVVAFEETEGIGYDNSVAERWRKMERKCLKKVEEH